MLKSILSNWVELIFSTLVVFILYPYLTAKLGADQYGVWLLLVSIVGYYSVFMLGIPLTSVRYITKHHAEEDFESLCGVVNTSLGIYLAMSVLVLCSGIGLSFFLGDFFNVSDSFLRKASISLIVLSINYAIAFPCQILESILHSFQKFSFINSVKICGHSIKLLLIFCFVNYNEGLILLAFIYIIVTVVQSSAYLLYVNRHFKFIMFGIAWIKPDVFKQIIGYSVAVLVFNFCSRISFQTDPMVIGGMISTAAIVVFSVANNFMIYLTTFMTGISRVLMPHVSRMSTNSEDKDKIGQLYNKYSRYVFFFALAACLGLYSLGKEFIAVWMGEEFSVPSYGVLLILLVSYLPFLVQRAVAFPILMGTSRMKFIAWTMTFTSLVNISLSIYLAKPYGLEGVAIGTSVANVLTTITIIVFMVKEFNLSLRAYLWCTMICPSLSGLFLLGPILGLKLFFSCNSYLQIALITVVSLLFYGSAIYLFFLSEEDQTYCRVKVQSLLRIRDNA